MDNEMVWIDGSLRPIAEVGLSPFDHGITVGDGVFETIKVVRPDGSTCPQAFALTRHLRRLRRSANGLGLTVPFTDSDLRRAVTELLDINGAAVGRLRITVTSGVAPLGSDRSDTSPTVIVASDQATPWPPSTAVVTVPWRRNEHSPVAGLKTTSYAENVVALNYARERGAGEAIFANTAGNLCEGTGSNIFVALGGRLVTPPLSAGCLAGIVRELLLEVVDVDEHDLPIGRLAEVDECFITSSTRDIMPVHAIDDRRLDPCPGPLTATASTAYARLEATDVDP